MNTAMEEVQTLAKEVRELDKRLCSEKNNMLAQFQEFVNTALRDVNLLEKRLEDVKNASKTVALHFCEDPEKFQLEECFRLFSDFFNKVKQAAEENEQFKKQEERSIRLAEQKKTIALSGKNKGEGKFQERRRSDDVCLVDLLMQEIRGGTFKLRRTTSAGLG